MIEPVVYTIIAGVLVFIVSQYILKLIIEPIAEFRKIIVEVSHTLLLHQAVITNPSTNDEELPNKLSSLSAQLRSGICLIPFYNFLTILHIFHIPNKNNILMACRELNILFYGVRAMCKQNVDTSEQAQKNIEILKNIAKCLNIETTYTKTPEEL